MAQELFLDLYGAQLLFIGRMAFRDYHLLAFFFGALLIIVVLFVRGGIDGLLKKKG